MNLYAIDPVSGKRLPVVIDGKVLKGLFGEVAASARILIDATAYQEMKITLENLGYYNSGPLWEAIAIEEEEEQARQRSERARRAAKARWSKAW